VNLTLGIETCRFENIIIAQIVKHFGRCYDFTATLAIDFDVFVFAITYYGFGLTKRTLVLGNDLFHGIFSLRWG